MGREDMGPVWANHLLSARGLVFPFLSGFLESAAGTVCPTGTIFQSGHIPQDLLHPGRDLPARGRET